jgi:hypothetical protein
MAKAFRARLLPNLGGSLVARMPVDRQIELGVYWRGRGEVGAQFCEVVSTALDQVKPWIDRGAGGDTGEASWAAMEHIYPALAGLLGGQRRRPGLDAGQGRGHAASRLDQEASPPKEAGRAETLPEIAISDDRVEVGVLGRRRELPEWYRPGSAPWFERGLGRKDVHPGAIRSDRETIVQPELGDPRRYHELWREVRREAGVLEIRLTRVLREQAYLRYGGRFRSGKLRTARLWKQRLGVYRLFEREIDTGASVAFTLLVDESASMKGQDKYRVAAMTATLLGEALDQLDIPLEIIGYTTSEFEARAAMRLGMTPAHAYRTLRCSPLEHRIYKRFDESFRTVRIRLSEIGPRRNNWDEESLLFAFRRIQARPEQAKVILMISDGQPNGDADHLIATVGSVERLGCRVIGIGIGADYVRRIYRNAIVVSDFRQTADELLRLLARELIGGPGGGVRTRALLGARGMPSAGP